MQIIKKVILQNNKKKENIVEFVVFFKCNFCYNASYNILISYKLEKF